MAPDDGTLGWIAVSRVAVLVDVNLYAFGAADLLRLPVAVLLVDVDFLAVLLGLLGTALAVFKDSYFLGVGVAVLSRSLSRLIDVD